MTEVTVTNNPDRSRYDVYVGAELAGFAEYRLNDDRITFTHTEIDHAFEGKGVGSVLARRALDDVRETGTRKVVPRCPFIKAWITRHPDYQDLLRRR